MVADSTTVVREYDRLAPSYDRRWSRYIQATTEATARRVEIGDRESLLDVGCGTGSLLDWFGANRPNVTLAGIDPSERMLAVARAKLPPSVRLQPGSAERIPFADASFDVVASNSAFHYFSRPAEALREMRRVLRRGGRLVLTDWCDDFIACKLCGLWLRWVDQAYVTMYGAADCTKLLSDSGLHGVRIERYKTSLLWGLMTASATKT